MAFAEYEHAFRHVRMRRTDGILELRLHTDDGPLVWGDGPHSELGQCFLAVGSDPENRIIILTGTGDSFIASIDTSWVGEMTPAKWNRIYTNGKRLLSALLDIEVPVVAAINGPASVHAELALLSDIVIASDDSYLQDAPHFRYGTVPGDGVQAIWPLLLGPNRGRFFLLTGQRISAIEAQQLGVVAEVHPRSELLDRGVGMGTNAGPPTRHHASVHEGGTHPADQGLRARSGGIRPCSRGAGGARVVAYALTTQPDR